MRGTGERLSTRIGLYSLAGGAGATALDVVSSKVHIFPYKGLRVARTTLLFLLLALLAIAPRRRIYLVSITCIPASCTTGTVPTTLFAYFVGTGKRPDFAEPSRLTAPKWPSSRASRTDQYFTSSQWTRERKVRMPERNPLQWNCLQFATRRFGGVHNSAGGHKNNAQRRREAIRFPPFVDYSGDIAYVGDDTGKLHKITGVFTGTPG